MTASSPTSSSRTPIWAMSKRWLLFIVEDENASFERRLLAADELKSRGVDLDGAASDLVARLAAYSAA